MSTQTPTSPKTVFCDIDGTLLKHHGDIFKNAASAEVLSGVYEALGEWERRNYRIILITGRKESQRKETEAVLQSLHIPYDHLLMGLPNGDRIVVNDRKPEGKWPTAYAISPPRNGGLGNWDITGSLVTLGDKYVPVSGRFEKPWGYEELVDVNHAYVVKKLFMKAGHSCSTQYHVCKRETILVFSGKLRIYIGPSLEGLESRVYGPGETVTIEPYTVHKMEGVEDAVYYETSTNELWDVVRLQDAYGRACEK
jgi:mannose-6-phosphate isomerase